VPKDEFRIRIQRPVAEVFDFVATNVDRNNPRWEAEVLSWTDVAPRPIGKGTAAVMHRVDGGKRRDAHLLCTEFEPNRRTAWKHTDPGPFQFALSFETVPVSARETELIARTDITLSGAMRLMAPLVRRRQARVGARLTGKVKELLDSGATTEPVTAVAGVAPTNAR
jgi:hypothetical protein